MTAITSGKARKGLYDHKQIKLSGAGAAEAIPAGALVSRNASGTVKNAITNDGYAILGVSEQTYATGDTVVIDTGIYAFTASGTIGQDSVGKIAYAIDNDTVALSGSSAVVGVILKVDAAGLVYVQILPTGK